MKTKARGFTLVEVMVALIVIAIGMLGIAKMQGLALSSTGASRSRALAAVEASGLAAAMQANRLYWSAAASLPGTIGITTAAGVGTVTVPDSATMQAAVTAASASSATCTGMGMTLSCYCTTGQAAPCTTINLAAADVYDWAQSLATFLPNATASVTCHNANQPVDCTIVISWNENAVAMTTQQQSALTTNGSTVPVSFTLYVVP